MAKKEKPAKPGFRPKPHQRTLFGKGRGPPLGPEEVLQIQIVEWLKMAVPQIDAVHAPNQLARTSEQRIIHTRMGMHAGVADLTLYGPGPFTAFLEVKTPGSYAKPHQRHFLAKRLSDGHAVGVVKSIDDVRNFLRAHGIRTRESLIPVQGRLL